MKKLTKIIIAFLMSFSIMTPVMAEDSSVETVTTDVVQRTGNHTVVTKISSGHKSNCDLGYHKDTSYWRKVSAYHFNSNSTKQYSFSFTASGTNMSATIGISSTTSTSFGYDVTADQSRYSKIRVYVGFDWTYYKAQVIDNTSGVVVRTYYYTTTRKTHENFKVVYE